MPTTKRRITLSLSPELDLAIARLSKATGQPQSQLLTGLLEAVVPHLHQLANAAEAAMSGKSHTQEAMQHLLGLATAVEQDAAEARDQVENLAGVKRQTKPKEPAGQ